VSYCGAHVVSPQQQSKRSQEPPRAWVQLDCIIPIHHIDRSNIKQDANMDTSLNTNMFSPKLDCSVVAHPDVPTTVLSIFIVVGILVSYIPQHLRIISRGSSEGLSPYFVLLGATSSTFAIFNILTLPRSQQDIACCKEINGFACVAGLLGIAQVAVQWSCFGLMYVLPPLPFITPPNFHCIVSSSS
jgi:hypothetical protein